MGRTYTTTTTSLKEYRELHGTNSGLAMSPVTKWTLISMAFLTIAFVGLSTGLLVTAGFSNVAADDTTAAHYEEISNPLAVR